MKVYALFTLHETGWGTRAGVGDRMSFLPFSHVSHRTDMYSYGRYASCGKAQTASRPELYRFASELIRHRDERTKALNLVCVRYDNTR